MKPTAKSTNILNHHDLGFTLVEILISLALVAILSALAIPSFSETIKRYRINAIRDELVASMQWARSEAIRRNTPIILVRQTNCNVETIDGDVWSCGWQAVVDTNRNSIANTSELVSQISSVPSGYDVMHTGLGKQLVFNRWGQITPLAQRFTISQTVDGVAGASTTTVCVSSGGRIRSLIGAASCD